MAKKISKKATAKKTPSKKASKTTAKSLPRATAKKAPSTKPKLLTGGNPQIAKGGGDAPVQAYIAAAPGWKQQVCKQVDALIMKAAPKTIKAVKWNSPFYGMEGDGWFLSYHCFTKYVKVTFFKGGSLEPLPPETSKYEAIRHIHIFEDAPLDEAMFLKWVKQASRLPGWKP